MFKIQNMSGGSLAIVLEKGSIILQPGKYFDLDGVCSRKWIHEDSDLRSMLREGGPLRLVHDSEVGVPSQPIHDIVNKLKSKTNSIKKKKKVKDPVVIDFSDIPDEIIEEPIEDLEDHMDALKEEESEDPIIDEPEDLEEEDEEETKEENDSVVCPECGKICKSERGLKVHMRVHEED